MFADIPIQVVAAGLFGRRRSSRMQLSSPTRRTTRPGGNLPEAVACLWLAVYAAGAAWHGWRWARAQRHLSALLRTATLLAGRDLADHPAFSPHRDAPCRVVLEIDAPVSPMLAGLVRPVLLLPRHIRGLPPVQQQLIVAHELMHLRRRDHWWQHAGQLVRMLLWFVPPVHGLYRRLQWAVETGCDRAVLAGRAPAERRSYAAALVAQLALQVRVGETVALAFGAQPLVDRIRLIRAADAAPRAHRASIAVTLLLLPAVCLASVLLQPRFVFDAPGSPRVLPSLAVAPPAAAWQSPLQQLHVNSGFGATNRPGGKPHGGVDLRARRGTAVMAPVAGRVAISTDHYAGGARYGQVIVIDHTDGTRSLYAHLDGRLVQAGDRVGAGRQIAWSGATGKVTGPHLHFEVSRNGANIDPLALLQPH